MTGFQLVLTMRAGAWEQASLGSMGGKALRHPPVLPAGAGSAIWIPAIPAGMTAVSTTLRSQGEWTVKSGSLFALWLTD